MEFSQILSPPVSPESTNWIPENDPFLAVNCFTCEGNFAVGNVADFHPAGYLRGGEFVSILRNDGRLIKTSCTLSRKYSSSTVTSAAVSLDYRSLFGLAKKHVQMLWSRLETPSILPFSQDQHNSNFQLRKDFCSILHFLKIQVMNSELDHSFSISADSEVEIHYASQLESHKQLLQDLKGLALYAGRISSLPENVLQTASSPVGNLCMSPLHHLFHLYLDFWWSLLEILHQTDVENSSSGSQICVVFCKNSPPGFESLFSQVALMLLWDLIFVSTKRFSKLQVSDLSRITPFSCPCMQEMCVMLIQLLNFRQDMMKEKNLWIYLDCVYQEILRERTWETDAAVEDFSHFCLKPSTFTCQDPVQFCLWFIAHLSSLFSYDAWGNFIKVRKVQSSYSQVQWLVRNGLSSQEELPDENQFCGILQSCLTVSGIWEPSLDLLLPLTEYFLRRLDNFQTAGLELIHQSGKNWLDAVKDKVINCSLGESGESSFHLFLRLTGLVVKTIFSEGYSNLWKQFKGRVFSKFHPKRVQELQDVGLFNCSLYFLTLAYSANLEEVPNKMCDLAEMLHGSDKSARKQAVVWKALLALLSCYLEKSVNMETVAKKVAALFADIARAFMSAASLSLQRQELLDLLLIYLKGIEDIFGCSQSFALSEYLLISPAVGHLLSESEPTEAAIFFNTVADIIAKFCHAFNQSRTYNREVYLDAASLTRAQQHESLANILCQQILPYVWVQAVGQHPPFQVADVAANLTLLTLHLSPKTGEERKSFAMLFNYFGLNEKISPSICCRYLSHLVDRTDVTNKLKIDITDFEVLLIRSWLRCGLCTLPHSAEMQKLSRFIMKLPELQEIFVNNHELPEVTYDHSSIMVDFFQSLGNSYHNKATVNEKVVMRKKAQSFLRDLVTTATGLVKQGGSKELYQHIYHIIGHLVLYCGQFLYTMSKPDSLLPSLLDGVLLPHTLYAKERPLSEAISSALWQYIPLFVQGLAQLGFPSDPFIGRKLKDIFARYMPAFEMKPAAVDGMVTHPLLNAIFQPSSICSVILLDLCLFVVKILFENFIMKTSVPHSHCSQAITFMGEIFSRSSFADKARIAQQALPHILESIMVINDSSREQLVELMNKILQHCHQNLNASERQMHVLPALRDFIIFNLPWKSSQVFQVLGYVCTQYSIAVNDVLPLVHETIQDVEKKRGVAEDPFLREGLKGLLMKFKASEFA